MEILTKTYTSSDKLVRAHAILEGKEVSKIDAIYGKVVE